MAQVIVSVQMVLEEKFVYKHDVHPLRAVGTEGTAVITYNVCIRCLVCTPKRKLRLEVLSVLVMNL